MWQNFAVRKRISHLCRIHRRKRRWISLTAQIMQTEPRRRKRQSQIRCGRRKTHRQVLIFLLMMRRLRIHWTRYIRRERRVQQKNRWTPQMFPCQMRTRLQWPKRWRESARRRRNPSRRCFRNVTRLQRQFRKTVNKNQSRNTNSHRWSSWRVAEERGQSQMKRPSVRPRWS